MKNIYIIPGFRHRVSGKAYKNISFFLKEYGYNPIPIKISWENNSILENTQRFIDAYRSHLSKSAGKHKNYILGFSFGAMIAFLAATKIKVDGLVLCSLSPFFKEDLPKRISKKRFNEFLNIKSSDIAKQIKTKQVHMLYGAKESKILINRVVKTFEKISTCNKYLTEIYDTDHNISDKKYLNQIFKTAKILN